MIYYCAQHTFLNAKKMCNFTVKIKIEPSEMNRLSFILAMLKPDNLLSGHPTIRLSDNKLSG